MSIRIERFAINVFVDPCIIDCKQHEKESYFQVRWSSIDEDLWLFFNNDLYSVLNRQLLLLRSLLFSVYLNALYTHLFQKCVGIYCYFCTSEIAALYPVFKSYCCSLKPPFTEYVFALSALRVFLRCWILKDWIAVDDTLTWVYLTSTCDIDYSLDVEYEVDIWRQKFNIQPCWLRKLMDFDIISLWNWCWDVSDLDLGFNMVRSMLWGFFYVRMVRFTMPLWSVKDFITAALHGWRSWYCWNHIISVRLWFCLRNPHELKYIFWCDYCLCRICCVFWLFSSFRTVSDLCCASFVSCQWTLVRPH